MSRIGSILKKDIKIIGRTKTSAAAVILGPLLVVLLVGLAFNTPNLYELNVGITGNTNLDIYQSIKNGLTSKNYLVLETNSETECIEKIKRGVIHTCIIIPQDFSIEGNNQIKFYVDNSRPNLVWKVIDSVSEETSLRAEELSYQLSSELLGVINKINGWANEGIAKTISLKQELTTIKEELSNTNADLSTIDLSTVTLDYSEIDSVISDIKSAVIDVKDEINDKVSDILNDDNATSSIKSKARVINETIMNYCEDMLGTCKENSTGGLIGDLNNALDNLNEQLDNINNDINDVNEKIGNNREKINNVISEIDDAISSIDSIKAKLEGMTSEIDSIKIKSAEKISKPIVTKIETVATEGTQILYMTPYLLMLLVMLVSLLLSGTIIVIEKNSRAMFRNYTTPTKGAIFIAGHFLSSLIIVFLEIAIISGIVYPFIGKVIFQNVLKVIPIVLFTAMFFILLGMLIGYIVKAQEGLTIGTLSAGTIFLFLSNLVLPLESMTKTLRSIANYNPYVLASEACRKVMLFNASWKMLIHPLLLLIGYSVIITIFIFVAQHFSRSSVLGKKRIKKAIEGININGSIINNKISLIAALHDLNDEEYERFKKELLKRKNYNYLKTILSKKELKILKSKGKKEFLDLMLSHNK